MSVRRIHRKGVPGPQPKEGGKRYARTIRFPLDINASLEDLAEEAGFDGVSDYVVAIVKLAKAADLWPTANPGQDRLPIGA